MNKLVVGNKNRIALYIAKEAVSFELHSKSWLNYYYLYKTNPERAIMSARTS